MDKLYSSVDVSDEPVVEEVSTEALHMHKAFCKVNLLYEHDINRIVLTTMHRNGSKNTTKILHRM